MIKDSDEIYDEVVRLTEDLRAGGREAEATRLDDAVAGGATGTETLYRLWAELRTMRYRPSGLDRPTRKRARKLARAIGRRLKSL